MHRIAAYVVSPARRHAMGRMGLRAAPGGFSPTYSGPEVMTTVEVEGTDIVTPSDAGLRRESLSSLAAAGPFVGVDPDVA